MQDALKKIFAPFFGFCIKGELENHLGYPRMVPFLRNRTSQRIYSQKRSKTSMGDVPIQIPRDRESTFEPQIIKKHQRDVTSIEGKVLLCTVGV